MWKFVLHIVAIAVGALHLLGCQAQSEKRMGHGEKVLVIGRHPDMLARVTAMLKTHGYNVFGAVTNEEAFQKFSENAPQAVVIGGGVDGESRALFHQKFSPAAKVIDAHPQTILDDLKTAFSN